MCNVCSSSSCGGCDSIKLQRGQRGNPGPQGAAATITIGTVTAVAFDDPPTVTNVGTTGAAIFDFEIPAGEDGGNAYTTLKASFVMPAANGSTPVTVSVNDNSWMVVGQIVFVKEAGFMQVFSTTGTDSCVLVNLANAGTGTYASNASPAAVIAADGGVSPGGLQGIQGAAGAGGTAATIAVGTTTTLSAGSPATVANVGSSSAATFNFGIPAGVAGTNGHTPELTVLNTGPGSGGVNGDWWIQQVNGGKWQVYSKSGGSWSAQLYGVLTANRMLGYSTTDPVPNPLGLAANAGDQWWTQIGSIVTLWVYNGTTWAVAVSFTAGGGGGGSDTLTTVIANSTGQLSGPLAANWERAILYVPRSIVTVSPGATTVFDLNYQYQSLSLLHDPQTLDYSALSSTRDTEWVFTLKNNTAGQVNLAYTAGKWTKSPGVTQPVILNAGEFAKIHCYYTDSKMNIAFVEQNVTAI